MQILNSIKSFKSIRHDNDFTPTTKCAKTGRNWWFVFAVSFMPRKSFWIISLARVRLDSREAEKALGDTDRVRHKGFLLSKEIGINQTNENTLLTSFNTNVRKLYFWGKSFCTIVSTVSFWFFSLKKVIKSTVCTTEGLWWCNCIFCINCIFFFALLYLFC